jgi:quinol monooxygenase YgiN
MIVEYIRYQIKPGEIAAFLKGYEEACGVLRNSPHCMEYDLSQCVDEPTQLILRIHWDSVEGHLKGFRTSPDFPRFFSPIRPWVGSIQEMRHYESTPIFFRRSGA